MADSERDLGMMLGQVLEACNNHSEKLDAIALRLDGHSKRLRDLESWRDRLSGAKGVIVAFWGSLVALALAGIALLRDWAGGK